MSHYVQAFVGARPVLELIWRPYGLSRVVDLSQRMAMLPLLPELYDAIPVDEGVSESGFMFLTPKIVRLIKETSETGTVGYFERNYFGGNGTQGAVLARLGEIVVGPRVGANSINGMLAQMGITVGHAHDEFDAIGLGRYRDNEEWVDQPAQRPIRQTSTMTGSLISWLQGLKRKS